MFYLTWMDVVVCYLTFIVSLVICKELRLISWSDVFDAGFWTFGFCLGLCVYFA